MTTFRRHPREFMRRLKRTKRPLVLTVNGKAEAVVQDAEAYQHLSRRRSAADESQATSLVFSCLCHFLEKEERYRDLFPSRPVPSARDEDHGMEYASVLAVCAPRSGRENTASQRRAVLFKAVRKVVGHPGPAPL
ncbi:MAG: type II toxin-antitoxin system Phd/YefM family antitoxin [Terriglobia bacterium]